DQGLPEPAVGEALANGNEHGQHAHQSKGFRGKHPRQHDKDDHLHGLHTKAFTKSPDKAGQGFIREGCHYATPLLLALLLQYGKERMLLVKSRRSFRSKVKSRFGLKSKVWRSKVYWSKV